MTLSHVWHSPVIPALRNLRQESEELKASTGCSGEICCRQGYQHLDRLTESHGLDNLQMRICLWEVGNETGSRDSEMCQQTPHTEGSAT